MRGETITVRRQGARTGEDSQGNPIPAVDEFEVRRCAFAPRSSDESTDVFGGRTFTGGTVYAPSGTVFKPSDVLIIRGEVWSIDGEAGQWTSPFTGRGKGVQVAVKRGG